MRAILSLLVFSIPVFLHADPSGPVKIKEVQDQVRRVNTILQAGNPARDAAELGRVAERGIELIAEAIGEVRNGIEGSLRAIHGTSTPRESEDPLFPFRIDHNTPGLMRGHILSGNMAPIGSLLEFSVVNVKLVADYLTLAQAAAMAKGLPRLPYGDYTLIRGQLRGALDTARRFFSALPQFPVSRPTSDGKREIDMERVQAFLSSLSPEAPDKAVPEAIKVNLLTAVRIIDDSFVYVDGYHYAFPQKGNDAALQHVSGALASLPGFHECVNLSRGLGDFEGEPCRIKEFTEGLQKYIDFYEKNSGSSTNLLSTLLEYLATFDEAEGATPTVEAWARLKTDLNWHIDNAEFHARVKSKWPEVRDRIFTDTTRLSELLRNGAELHQFLKDTINASGLTPRSGFDGDYVENIEGAKQLLRRFNEQKLGDAPATLSRIDSTTSCKLFLDNDTANSPWTVNTLVSADADPRIEPSSEGYARIIWSSEVKAGNAVAIQNTQLADKMLAGLSQRTAIAMILPNIVHTRLLLGRSAGSELTDIGIREKEGDALSTAQRHFRLPGWKAILTASEAAFRNLVHAYEEATGESASTFRAKFRADLNRGAEQIREVNTALERVKNEGHRMTDPAIATILQISTDYTGEFDPRYAAQINHSLIHTFLPVMIQEYIYRKYPQARTDRALYARHFNDLKSNFTIDQFMDQMEWYAWPDYAEGSRLRWELIRNGTIGPREPPYDGPFRKPGMFSGPRVPIIGVEEFKILYRFPLICARLLNHTLDSYQRKIDYLEYAQKRLYYQFPALKYEDRWQGYDDSRFEATLEAFLANAVSEANRVMELSSTKEILDYFVPNLPLMDSVLRRHPDQKKKLCEEQKDRRIWDERMETILTTVSMAATTAAYVPVLAPVGIAVEGVVLVIEGIRAYHKYREFARAEAWVFAAATQMTQDDMEMNAYHRKEMQMEYGMAVAKLAIHVALVAPAVAMKIPPVRSIPFQVARYVKAARRAVHVVRSELRAARAVEEAAVKLATANADKALWFANSSTRLARVLDFLNKTRHKLMSPLMRLRLAERWTHNTLYQRFWLNFSLKRAHRFVGNVPGAAKDLFFNFPWSLMGYQWGNGLLVKGIQWYSLSELSLWMVHAIRGANDVATELVMERVHEDPESYKDLVNGMYAGEYRHDDLVTMVEIDDRLGAEYRTKSHELVDTFYRSLEPEERANVIANFRAMEAELDRQIREEEARRGFDPNKVRILKRTRRNVTRTLRSLNVLRGAA